MIGCWIVKVGDVLFAGVSLGLAVVSTLTTITAGWSYVAFSVYVATALYILGWISSGLWQPPSIYPVWTIYKRI